MQKLDVDLPEINEDLDNKRKQIEIAIKELAREAMNKNKVKDKCASISAD